MRSAAPSTVDQGPQGRPDEGLRVTGGANPETLAPPGIEDYGSSVRSWGLTGLKRGEGARSGGSEGRGGRSCWVMLSPVSFERPDRCATSVAVARFAGVRIHGRVKRSCSPWSLSNIVVISTSVEPQTEPTWPPEEQPLSTANPTRYAVIRDAGSRDCDQCRH